jgi:hypothetical protein
MKGGQGGRKRVTVRGRKNGRRKLDERREELDE